MKSILFWFGLLAFAGIAHAADNVLANPSFEDGTTGWYPAWSRDKGQVKGEVVAAPVHSGKSALRVAHTGKEDWSLGSSGIVTVQPGEIYAFSAWIKIEQGDGNVECSVVARDAKDGVLDWQCGVKRLAGVHDWQKLSGRFLIPENCANINFRLTGRGPATAVFDDIEFTKARDALRNAVPDAEIVLSGGGTRLAFSPREKMFRLSNDDGKLVFPVTAYRGSVLQKAEQPAPSRLNLLFIDTEGADWNAEIEIDEKGEVLFTAKGSGALNTPIEFPGPIHSSDGQDWVVPINEGLLIPATDPHFMAWDTILYSGHGLCMPFLGLAAGEKGLLAIAETQTDALARFEKPAAGAGSKWSFVWQPSREEWSYERKLRMKLVGSGGYVGIAKAYREWAKKDGRFVTLKEKAKTVPQVEKLVGAVNFWWWEKGEEWKPDRKPEEIGKEIKDAGIERVLWSSKQDSASIKALNELGFLTGRYDICQDVWSPETPMQWLNKEGWPDDLVLLKNGDFMRGWVHKDKNVDYPGGVISSKPGLDILRRRTKDDLATTPYGARFLDTTTASPLREDYNPRHPLSRADDRTWKMKQLAALSGEFKLVTGSETGMDMAVPYLHYFEGMMSLGPYRLPDSGYDLFSYKKPQDDFLRFQTGPFYRIPLFELVYHECIVSYGYWGDSSNRIPEVWDERDLLCALYGVPPIFVTDRARWNKDKARYVQSYKNSTESARLTGYSEMLQHRFLNAAHTLQMSSFADGTIVYANFGAEPAALPDGRTLSSKHSLVIPGAVK